MTHHIPWDRPGTPQTRMKAICGAIIRRDESAPRPTCPACRAILKEWDAVDKDIADALNAEVWER